MSDEAAISTLSAVLAVCPGKAMKLSTLALPKVSGWSQTFKPALGPIKEFLSRHPRIFHVQHGTFAGTDVITLIAQQPLPEPVPVISPARNERITDPYALPRPGDDLWRPFDRRDSFYNDPDRLERIRATYMTYWQRYFDRDIPTSPLFNMNIDDAKLIYDQAFNKCARLTIAISYVVSQNLTAMEVKREFENYAMAVGDNQVKLYLFKDEINHNKIYSETYATVWGPEGSAGLSALENVVDALNSNWMQFQGKTLRLYCVGYGPVRVSIARGITEVLRLRRINAAIRAPLPPAPVDDIADNRPLTPQAQRLAPLPEAPLFPREIVYDSLNRPVVDPQSAHMQQARAALADKEALLRQKCAEQRRLPKDDQDLYDNRSGVEWMGGEEFILGSGREATIHMGLFRDLNAETAALENGASSPTAEPERALVAVKYCNYDNPFQTQEMEHFVSLKKQPGIVQYHTGFVLKYGASKHNILVQEMGLCSLRKFLTGDEASRLPPYTLSAEEKFKLTKALCMAVHELHELKPSITHRDIRPENVLIMPNGTIALTDFGLARRAPHRFKGTSVHIKNRLTTMQPHEVQKLFQEDIRAIQEIPVDPTADVFMLGLVIAYVHLNFDPYEDDGLIMSMAPPNLGTQLEHEQPWLYHLLRRMLDHTAEKRPSMENVLRHPYFCTWSENFDVSLVARVENVIVSDYQPVDNKMFRTLETLLEPIERELAAAGTKWHQVLPANLFAGQGRLPDVSTLRFQTTGASPPRAYSLSNVAQLVKWLRNVRTHFPSNPQQQDALRRSRALVPNDSGHYETAGDFFMFHPAVEWLLPKVWWRSVELLQACYQRQREFKRRYEEALRAFEEEGQELEDSRDALDSFLA